MLEEKNNSEQCKNENYENKYLSQFYSFLNSNYIKNTFENKLEYSSDIKKKHISCRKAYKYLIRKFKKVAIESDLYLEEIEIRNGNEKLIIQLFGKNSVTLKKLYKKKKLIDHYFFLLILFNVLSNLPYSITPIQKFINICDSYTNYGINLLMDLNWKFYRKRKKIHKIYFEPVFHLLILLWNNHYFHISLSNTLIILTFFYKMYIILKKLQIRNVNLFDNIYILCSSYVNKINSMLWFSIYLIIKRMLIDECEIKIMKKKKTYLILPIFTDIIKILDVYDEIIKKTNINPLVKLYEELKLFLFFFFHKLLYNLIIEQNMIPQNIFKYLQINNNFLSNKKKKYNKLISYNCKNKKQSEIYNSYYKYTNSINENFIFLSFIENFCLFNSFTEDKTNYSFSSLSFSFNSINSSSLSNENELVNKKKREDLKDENVPDNIFSKNEKPFQIIKMCKNKIEILNMQYSHFFIHKCKNENKYILLIKSYFNDYLCALVNSLYIYSKTIYSPKNFKKSNKDKKYNELQINEKKQTNEDTNNEMEDDSNQKVNKNIMNNKKEIVEEFNEKKNIETTEKENIENDNEKNLFNGERIDDLYYQEYVKIDNNFFFEINNNNPDKYAMSDNDSINEFNMIHNQKIQNPYKLMENKKEKKKKFGENKTKIFNILISFIEVIYRNIFKKILKKINNSKSIIELKLYSYIEKIYEYNTYYCLKNRLKKFCFILFFSVTLKNLIKEYICKINKEKVNKNTFENFQSTLIYDTCSFIKIYNQLIEIDFKDFFDNKYINFLIYLKNILTLPSDKLLHLPIKNKYFFYYISNKRIDINFNNFIEDYKLKNAIIENKKINNENNSENNSLSSNNLNVQFEERKKEKKIIENKDKGEKKEDNTLSSINPLNKKKINNSHDCLSRKEANEEKECNNMKTESNEINIYNDMSDIDNEEFSENEKKSIFSQNENNVNIKYPSNSGNNSEINKNEKKKKKDIHYLDEIETIRKCDLDNPSSDKSIFKKNKNNSFVENENNSFIENENNSFIENENNLFIENKNNLFIENKNNLNYETDTSKTYNENLNVKERKKKNTNSLNQSEDEIDKDYDISSIYSEEFDYKKKIKKKNTLFEMNEDEIKNCIKVYIKNANGQFDRKILILKDDKIYFYNSENSISYDSFYFLMEIKKIYSYDGFFDSLISSQKLNIVNSTNSSSTDDDVDFYSKNKESFSSESEWQKCGFDAKIIFHNSLRKNIQLMFIDQDYEKFVTKINNVLVQERDRNYEYVNLSYDKNIENQMISEYLNNNIKTEENKEKYFSTKSNSISENESSDYKDSNQYNNNKLVNTDNKYDSSQNDIEENENILNNILNDNKDILEKKNNSTNNSQTYINFEEYRYSSSTTDIYIKEKNYFSKKQKIKVKKENKMKLFKNINKNDIYNLFFEEIYRLYKNKNNNISKKNSDDLFFYKSVNKLYFTINLS
ncbi:conserved Plasmodium protein, unknown function [Plasmodium gallinaceum]|uniref:Uncharacterized protein n=1 Tax=Plasmodium gallinaceum TaxID=5849 RepID=A0A1J1GTK1_PLAGA|nr:conserved Plasmodium protein, unknown function [Plasmodium gallinaceum]CRG94379.1 conserved Plasmodium protein, unknown function [Plasmodium gallinaceum]